MNEDTIYYSDYYRYTSHSYLRQVIEVGIGKTCEWNNTLTKLIVHNTKTLMVNSLINDLFLQ